MKSTDILAWLDEMADHGPAELCHLARSPQAFRRRKPTAYAMETLISSIRLAGLLRKDGALRSAIRASGILMGLKAGWMDERCPVPSKSTISRHRLTLDAGFALCVQRRLHTLLESGEPFAVYLLADSSPRAGKEWLLSEYYLVKQSDALAFCDAQDRLMNMQEPEQRDDIEAAKCSEVMHGAVWHHICVPVALGAKTWDSQRNSPPFCMHCESKVTRGGWSMGW